MSKVIKNDTLSFLLPMLATRKFDREFFINDYFIGAFIGDINRYEYDHEVLLVYERQPLLPFYEFLLELHSHPDYTGISYDYPDHNFIVYVFKVPVAVEEEFYKVLEGSYSKLNAETKLQIVKFWEAQEQTNSKVFNIIFKTDRMKQYWINKGIDPEEVCTNGELWGAPVEELELFNIENF